MKWDKKSPCNNCPFLRGTPMSLHPDRVREIGGMMLSSDGGTFPCHKTTVDVEDDEGSSDREATPESQHCAGALIFAEVHGNATQMMRIAERLRLYDAKALMSNQKVVDSVFGSLDEMYEHLTRFEK